MTDALTWAGTFHGIGARLLRDTPSRSDSIPLHHPRPRGFRRPDESGPARARLLARPRAASRPRAPASRSIPASSTPKRRSTRCSAPFFPWCAGWAAELRELFAAYVEAKQAQNVLDYDDLLLYWAQMVAEPALAAEIGGRFDHVLVDEYQDTNRLQSSILLALKPGRPRADRRRRRRAVDLFLPRGDRPQHPRLSRPVQPAAEIVTLDRNYRSTPADPGGRQRGDRSGRGALHQEPVDRAAVGAKPQLVTVRDEADQARYIVEQVLENREGGIDAQGAGCAVSHLHP